MSVNGRWDGDVLKGDEAHRDFLNRIYLVVVHRPSTGH
jgi:hypothetical protein